MLTKLWERRLVHQASSKLEDHAAFLKEALQIDQQNPTDDDEECPRFHRSELQLGKLLGQGEFSQAFELRGVDLKDRFPRMTTTEKRARRDFERKCSESEAAPVYCVKHLKRKLLKKPTDFYGAANDIMFEMHMMRMLDHPNLLKLRGAAQSNDSKKSLGSTVESFFLITDRLTQTLHERIHVTWASKTYLQGVGALVSKNRLLTKCTYALQMASALSYLHERRIIYRDYKPANLGFLPDDSVQLFDFGLCRILPTPADKEDIHDNTYRMSMAGTTRYMAVELLMHRSYGLKADVYSFAMTLYEMIAERKPFVSFQSRSFSREVAKSGVRPNLTIFGLPKLLHDLMQSSWHQQALMRPTMKDNCKTLEKLIETLKESLIEGPSALQVGSTDERSELDLQYLFAEADSDSAADRSLHTSMRDDPSMDRLWNSAVYDFDECVDVDSVDDCVDVDSVDIETAPFVGPVAMDGEPQEAYQNLKPKPLPRQMPLNVALIAGAVAGNLLKRDSSIDMPPMSPLTGAMKKPAGHQFNPISRSA